MAKRITQEQIEQINEVYAQCGVKSKTAEIVGVSVASVNKYLIPDYIPKSQKVEIQFDGEPQGADKFVEDLKNSENPIVAFCQLCNLNERELNELREVQKGLI